MSLHYHCPLCKLELTLNDKTYRCDNNHSFDIAKEGYVNLLPVQNKKSKQPGDNLEMVQARRAFFKCRTLFVFTASFSRASGLSRTKFSD